MEEPWELAWNLTQFPLGACSGDVHDLARLSLFGPPIGARIEGEDTTVFYRNLFMSVWTLPKLEDELTCLCHA